MPYTTFDNNSLSTPWKWFQNHFQKRLKILLWSVAFQLFVVILTSAIEIHRKRIIVNNHPPGRGIKGQKQLKAPGSHYGQKNT